MSPGVQSIQSQIPDFDAAFWSFLNLEEGKIFISDCSMHFGSNICLFSTKYHLHLNFIASKICISDMLFVWPLLVLLTFKNGCCTHIEHWIKNRLNINCDCFLIINWQQLMHMNVMLTVEGVVIGLHDWYNQCLHAINIGKMFKKCSFLFLFGNRSQWNGNMS